MTHRAETIMDTVLTLVTGLTTTGANTERGKVRTKHAFPSLSIEQGADNVAPDRSSYPRIGKDLHVKIMLHVKTNSSPDTQLNLMREEVFAALMADRTLGLGFVSDVEPIGDAEPELSGESEQIVGRQEMTFVVKYSHQWDNAGA